LLLAIDEADQIPEGVPIGTLIRSTKEMLSAEGLEGISFILAGQKTLLPRMKNEHPSVPRSFEILWLNQLSLDQCKEIVLKGERQSGIEFDPEIRNTIAESSRGFPAVVQKLADSCVRVDRDRYVDILDFEDALSNAIELIRGEEILNSILDMAGQPGRDILLFMSDKTQFLAISQIFDNVRYPNDVTKATVELMTAAGVLDCEDSGYRISDRLLAAYISLEETRSRDLRNVRELSRLFEQKGWVVRVVGPGEHRGIDLVMSRKRYWLKQRVGAAYIGLSDRIGIRGLSHLEPHFKRSMEIYNLDEIWLVGRGHVSNEVLRFIERQQWLSYIPMDMIDRIRF